MAHVKSSTLTRVWRFDYYPKQVLVNLIHPLADMLQRAIDLLDIPLQHFACNPDVLRFSLSKQGSPPYIARTALFVQWENVGFTA